jgi:hypothetical protein
LQLCGGVAAGDVAGVVATTGIVLKLTAMRKDESAVTRPNREESERLAACRELWLADATAK